MTRFIQLHFLTSYPPANLNRDDLGRPKTAYLGGVERLRISSQSLKRAWRTSELFKQLITDSCIDADSRWLEAASNLADTVGVRTKRLGVEVAKKLVAGGITEKQATDWAKQIAGVYGKLKSEKGKELEIEQLVHIAPEEEQSLKLLVETLIQEKRAPNSEELEGLLHTQAAVDIAMFGRMLASKPDRNSEAAVQVAHAIGVHASAVEDDYFTAVDDLNLHQSEEEQGAAHLGEAGFAAAVFYQYLCIDRDLLKRNLGDDEALTTKALRALIEAVLKVGPNGKQNSYASRAYAHFALAEKGSQQPRSLSLAFVKPVSGSDYTEEGVQALERVRHNMDKVYGACSDQHYKFNVLTGEGSVEELLNFVAAE